MMNHPSDLHADGAALERYNRRRRLHDDMQRREVPQSARQQISASPPPPPPPPHSTGRSSDTAAGIDRARDETTPVYDFLPACGYR